MDAAGGAAVSAMSVLLIAWFIGSAVASAPYPAVTRQVDYSVVLRGVGRLMPGAAHDMFSDFGRMLAHGPSGQVFGVLGGEGAWAMRPPDPGVVDAPGLARDRRSIVMIEGSSATCPAGEGSGFVFAPHHVLTNAHVVAATTGAVVTAGRHAHYRARVVYFDPRRDIAVLYVPGLHARPLHFAGRHRAGARVLHGGGSVDRRAGHGARGRGPVGLHGPATAPHFGEHGEVTAQRGHARAPGPAGRPVAAGPGTAAPQRGVSAR